MAWLLVVALVFILAFFIIRASLQPARPGEDLKGADIPPG